MKQLLPCGWAAAHAGNFLPAQQTHEGATGMWADTWGVSSEG